MRKEVLYMLVLIGLGVAFFSEVPNAIAEEDVNFVATVIDTANSETEVHDLYLSYYKRVGGFVYREYKGSAKDMLIKIGESEITIPFNNISEIEFEWAETEDGKSSVTITTLNGVQIKGEPGRVSHWTVKGKTGEDDFKLSVDETKKIIFSHGIKSASATMTSTSNLTSPQTAVEDIVGYELKVHDIYLSYYKKVGGYVYREYKDSAKSMIVIMGESELIIPFDNISEMEFEWAETEDGKSNITITTLSGEQIKGEPGRVSGWTFKGKTGEGDFKLDVDKTKKIIFSHETTSTSETIAPSLNLAYTPTTVIDTAGCETIVYDLYLSFYNKVGGYVYREYKGSAKDILVIRGETEVTIPFDDIKEVEFEWSETEDNKSSVTVTKLNGEQIRGEPGHVAHWTLKGETDYGHFRLSADKTKKIIMHTSSTAHGQPGFEVVFSIIGLLTVAYILNRKNKS